MSGPGLQRLDTCRHYLRMIQLLSVGLAVFHVGFSQSSGVMQLSPQVHCLTIIREQLQGLLAHLLCGFEIMACLKL